MKESFHESFEPIEFGGEMVEFVSKDNATFSESPIKYEAEPRL